MNKFILMMFVDYLIEINNSLKELTTNEKILDAIYSLTEYLVGYRIQIQISTYENHCSPELFAGPFLFILIDRYHALYITIKNIENKNDLLKKISLCVENLDWLRMLMLTNELPPSKTYKTINFYHDYLSNLPKMPDDDDIAKWHDK